MPGWARKGVGTSTPAQNLNWKGKEYLVGNLCKPHDCGNNFDRGVQRGQIEQGVRVEVEDRPEAVDHPRSMYQWLGKPNDDMKALLKQQFENNPDWK